LNLVRSSLLSTTLDAGSQYTSPSGGAIVSDCIIRWVVERLSRLPTDPEGRNSVKQNFVKNTIAESKALAQGDSRKSRKWIPTRSSSSPSSMNVTLTLLLNGAIVTDHWNIDDYRNYVVP